MTTDDDQLDVTDNHEIQDGNLALNHLFLDTDDPENDKDEELIRAYLEKIKNTRKKLASRKEQKRSSSIREVGEVAEKADILLLDRTVLLGALLEVKQVIKNADSDTIQRWKKAGEKAMDAQHEQNRD